MSTTGGNAEVIAKKGDVILRLGKDGVGEGVRNVLVASVALSLASPVFAAMFDGRFSEGHNLSPASPRTVPLPDDDPESIIMICKIAHIQTSQLPVKTTAMAVSKLALACNKYDCVDGVRPWAIIWIAALLEDPDAADFEKILLATHLLELPSEFSRVSQRLMRDRNTIFSVTKAMDGHEFLPLLVYEHVLLSQLSYQRDITTAFASIVTGKEACQASNLAIGTFLQYLKSVNLWPINQYSVPIISSRLGAVPESNTPLRNCGTSACVCRSATRPIKAILTARINMIYNKVEGLCLDCVRQKVLGEQKRECRVSHVMKEAMVYP